MLHKNNVMEGRGIGHFYHDCFSGVQTGHHRPQFGRWHCLHSGCTSAQSLPYPAVLLVLTTRVPTQVMQSSQGSEFGWLGLCHLVRIQIRLSIVSNFAGKFSLNKMYLINICFIFKSLYFICQRYFFLTFYIQWIWISFFLHYVQQSFGWLLQGLCGICCTGEGHGSQVKPKTFKFHWYECLRPCNYILSEKTLPLTPCWLLCSLFDNFFAVYLP